MYDRNITFGPCFHGHPINASPTLPCHGEILSCIWKRMVYMTSNYRSVMYIHLVLTFRNTDPCPSDNDAIRQLMNSLSQNLNRNGMPHQYIWVYEDSQDGGHHHHLALLVATNWPQAFYVIVNKVKELWTSATNGIVNDCTRDRDGNPQENGIFMVQGTLEFPQTFERCFHWASYLAKTKDKYDKPFNLKTFGSSRLPSEVPIM
jgi:hypothetical protein